MVKIENLKIYELEESIIACRNAMRTSLPDYKSLDEFEKSLNRAISLCKTPSNSGEANFLTGIRVAFDITYPNYFSPELQRYHWIDIVTSSSKMHKLSSIIMADSFNKYVSSEIIEIVRNLAVNYNIDPTYENRIKLLSNCPQGIELFMRVSTNYMQLKNIYHQRKNHRLKEDWGEFCSMIENLPYFEEFINTTKL
jgi:hypothetical protein